MIEATNNFVFIIRDKTQTETSGLLIPGQGQEKPHRGTIYSAGALVRDKKIKANKASYFHKGTGFEIEVDNEVYLVLTDDQIIGIEK